MHACTGTIMLSGDRRKREVMTREFRRFFFNVLPKEIKATLSLKPTTEGAKDFYLTISAIKVSKMLRLPCHFDPRCSLALQPLSVGNSAEFSQAHN